MAIDVHTHPVGPERNLFTRSDSLLVRLGTSVLPFWVPRELGFTVRVDWPAAAGADASHSYVGSLRSTPRSAEKARRRLEAYWSRSPSRPCRTMIVYMSSVQYKAHWKRHPCNAPDCPGAI